MHGRLNDSAAVEAGATVALYAPQVHVAAIKDV